MERGENFRRFRGVDGVKGEVAISNECIRIVDGSRLYGTSLDEGGDEDQMGVFIEPPDYVIGFQQMEQYKWRSQPEGVKSGPGDLDLTIYSLRKYLSLALQGNPSVLMLLFAPEHLVLYENLVGIELQDLYPLIISKRAHSRFVGYLKAQRMRLTGEKRGHTPSRPELIAQHGYDTKFAMHAARLGYQGIELMETGRLTLPIEGELRDHLVGIRSGEHSYQGVLAELEAVEERLMKSHDSSDLRDEPDFDAIEEWLIQTHLDHWRK